MGATSVLSPAAAVGWNCLWISFLIALHCRVALMCPNSAEPNAGIGCLRATTLPSIHIRLKLRGILCSKEGTTANQKGYPWPRPLA